MEIIKSTMNKIQDCNLPPTLRQGLNFKKYQKEITTNPRAVAIANDLEEKDDIQGFDDLKEDSEKVVEGFEGAPSETIMTPSNPVSQDIQNQLLELEKLQTEYNTLLEQYATANNASAEKVKVTLKNTVSNPYAGKYVKLNN